MASFGCFSGLRRKPSTPSRDVTLDRPSAVSGIQLVGVGAGAASDDREVAAVGSPPTLTLDVPPLPPIPPVDVPAHAASGDSGLEHVSVV